MAVAVSTSALAQGGAPGSCALTAAAGVAEQRLTSGGRERSYRLFVPASYDGRSPLPLVLDLHGSGGTAERQAGTSGFEALAEREDFVVATLQAQAEGNRWNVPITDGRPDDVAYVPDALAGWAGHNGCDADVVLEDPPGPLSTLRYEGCRDGAEVRLVRIDGLVHAWARDEIDATAAMWQFFRSHTLPD